MKTAYVSFLLVLLPHLGTLHSTSAFHVVPLSESPAVRSRSTKLELYLTSTDQEIGLWTMAFSTTHIGMSAIRQDIIRACGQGAKSLKLVGNANWRLPEFWPGDDDGGSAIFPSAEVAGRQIYRILYTAVSFTTLGSAFFAYLESLHQNPPNLSTVESIPIVLWISILSWAVSTASLLNPSPFSLVPVFEAGEDKNSNNQNSQLQRNDSRKLLVYGMTRITRHPLILPVVPWGFSTAISLGGQPRDYLFFGILALYAIAGCYAQDLRVSRQEGSVGTVFNPDDSLQAFFDETSFVPFRAVLDGRQSMTDIAKEVPWWAFALGILIGYQLQTFFLQWIVSQASQE